MSFLITKPTSCNDIILVCRSTIFVGLKMFTGALEVFSLAKRDLVL